MKNNALKQAKICIFLNWLAMVFVKKLRPFPYIVLMQDRAIKSVV